jgi:hypothetical protein
MSSLQVFNPNPGGLVANMTCKTQNCYDKFTIHKKNWKKFVILHKSILCLILNKQVFITMMSC